MKKVSFLFALGLSALILLCGCNRNLAHKVDITSLPAATPGMFSLGPMDTALFIGALTQDPPHSDGGMTLPYVGVFGQYEENSRLYAICHVGYQRYCTGPDGKLISGSTITYGRAILTKHNDGTYTCDSFNLVGEGEGYDDELRMLCGPMTGLADKILRGEIMYTSTFPSIEDMRSQYYRVTGIDIR